MSRGRTSWLLVAFWAAVIFFISAIPRTNLPDLVLFKHDKALHGCLYAPLGALIFLALRSPNRFFAPGLTVAAGLAAGIYGITDEFHQKFVPGRSPDWGDVLADLVGGLAGAAIVLGVTAVSKKRAGSSAGPTHAAPAEDPERG